MSDGSVLVTGASTGIGEACALAFDRLGWDVFAGVRRAKQEIAALLARGGGMIFAVRDHANDYWDWVLRDGRIGFVNVITWRGLQAFAEVAECQLRHCPPGRSCHSPDCATRGSVRTSSSDFR